MCYFELFFNLISNLPSHTLSVVSYLFLYIYLQTGFSPEVPVGVVDCDRAASPSHFSHSGIYICESGEEQMLFFFFTSNVTLFPLQLSERVGVWAGFIVGRKMTACEVENQSYHDHNRYQFMSEEHVDSIERHQILRCIVLALRCRFLCVHFDVTGFLITPLRCVCHTKQEV